MECCPVEPSLVTHLDPDGLHLSHMKHSLLYPYYLHNDSHLTCVEFSKTEMLLSAGTDSGTVNIYNLSSDSSEPMKLCASLAARSPARGRCRAVSWNGQTNRIAAGFDKEGGLRENGVVVFDMNMINLASSSSSISTSGQKPVTGSAFGESAVSVQWIGEPDQLAFGGTKWFRIWDVRAPPETALRIMAHQKIVRGIESDPFRSHILCTWSDGHAEPINIWDLRKLDQNSSAFTCIKPFECSSSTHSTVLQAQWSPFSSGQLASIQSDFRHVTLWDVNSDQSPVNVPIQVYSTASPLRSICWSRANTPSRVASKEALLYLPQTTNQSITNEVVQVASLVGFQPIALSVNSDIASTYQNEVKVINGSIDIDLKNFDMSAVMKERAMNGYAIDVGKSLQVLSDEMDMLSSSPSEEDNVQFKAVKSLSNMWSWVGRVEHQGGLVEGAVETLLNIDEDTETVECESSFDSELHCHVFSSTGRHHVLEVCGWVAAVKDMTNQEGEEEYDDNDHGGDDDNDYDNNDDEDDDESVKETQLQRLISVCEGNGEIDRACCLAVFHGDLSAALSVLTNAQNNRKLAQDEENHRLNQLHHQNNGGHQIEVSHYNDGDDMEAELLFNAEEEKEYQLRHVVAMCIAGYSANPNPLWLEMCQSICGSGYLRRICTFLYQLSMMTMNKTNLDSSSFPSKSTRKGTSNKDQHLNKTKLPNNKYHSSSSSSESVPSLQGVMFQEILLDENICLEDRLAFSARFLPHMELMLFLEYEMNLKSSCGDLEGFMLLGFRQAGINLLQNYLDRSGDIQTVALLCTHVEKDRLVSSSLPLSSSPSSSSSSTSTSMQQKGDKQLNDWIECYRELLDGWQLWKQRALFDVGRASLIRGDADMTSSTNVQSAKSTKLSTNDSDAGLFIRCNFCNFPIPLTMLCQQASLKNKSWLQQQKPVLTCCPSCRNFLPKCYVCLLSLGCLNPWQELKHRAQTSARNRASRMGSQSFEHWSTWCQVCKHGGHANHIADWFQSHTTCGVSGCDCNCASL